MKKSLILFVIVAATLLIQGCAAKEESVAHGDIKGKSTDISTGNFFEFCDMDKKWKPGDTVNFSFVSSKPVMFEVHYHEKHAKVYPVEPTLTEKLEGSFVVESDAIYCGMWKNDNPKYVTLTYDMSLAEK
jgi:hypothetical protein